MDEGVGRLWKLVFSYLLLSSCRCCDRSKAVPCSRIESEERHLPTGFTLTTLPPPPEVPPESGPPGLIATALREANILPNHPLVLEDIDVLRLNSDLELRFRKTEAAFA